jgi:hypothetical protein
MRVSVLLFIIGFLWISCSPSKEDFLEKVSGPETSEWKILSSQGITDSLHRQGVLPDAELSIQFKNKQDTCIAPTFEFYPISYKKYVEKQLYRYLGLRAMLYPPPPILYVTKDYFILGWNFADYNASICCDCERLETYLTQAWQLKKEVILEELDLYEWRFKKKKPQYN